MLPSDDTPPNTLIPGRTLFGRCNWYFILDLEIDLPAQLGNFYNWCIRVVLAQLLSIEKSSVWIFCDDDDTHRDDHNEKLIVAPFSITSCGLREGTSVPNGCCPNTATTLTANGWPTQSRIMVVHS